MVIKSKHLSFTKIEKTRVFRKKKKLKSLSLFLKEESILTTLFPTVIPLKNLKMVYGNVAHYLIHMKNMFGLLNAKSPQQVMLNREVLMTIAKWF